jgi:AP2 domain
MAKKERARLTAERLRAVLSYDPSTGNFTNRINRRRAKAGQIAGGLGPHGYWLISVDGQSYSAQSLAHLYVTGTWIRYVDHINGCTLDNRWINLRAATSTQKLRRDNTSGYKGVCLKASTGKWLAQIGTGGGRRKHLGYFTDKLEAAAAYAAAAQERSGESAKEARRSDPISASIQNQAEAALLEPLLARAELKL